MRCGYNVRSNHICGTCRNFDLGKMFFVQFCSFEFSFLFIHWRIKIGVSFFYAPFHISSTNFLGSLAFFAQEHSYSLRISTHETNRLWGFECVLQIEFSNITLCVCLVFCFVSPFLSCCLVFAIVSPLSSWLIRIIARYTMKKTHKLKAVGFLLIFLFCVSGLCSPRTFHSFHLFTWHSRCSLTMPKHSE